MNIFPNRLIYLESNEVFSQAAEYRELADKLGGEYVPIEFEGVVTFDPGDSLVKKLVALYHIQGNFGKSAENFDRKKATAAAVEITARMAQSAANQEAPGFNVDYIRAGDKLEFLSGDKVRVTYTPRGEKAPKVVTLDLTGAGRHEGTIDESRAAWEGSRSEVFEEAIDMHSMYNVFKVLGYEWNNPTHQKDFLTKLNAAGFEGSDIFDQRVFEFLSKKITEEESDTVFDRLKTIR